jgi:hypothetical protein
VSSNKSRDFKSRCEGALDEIASVGGDISAGRAATEAEVLKMIMRTHSFFFQSARWSTVGCACLMKYKDRSALRM